MLVIQIHDELASLRVQREVGEGHHDVPSFLDRPVRDPPHQGGKLFGLRGEGLAGNLDLEPSSLPGLVGEPGRKHPGHAPRDLRRRVRIRQQSHDGHTLGRHSQPLPFGCARERKHPNEQDGPGGGALAP